MIGVDQSWVTLAQNDVQAWQALVLARSIKRTYSTRKLTILISDTVTPALKFILQQEYDLVMPFGKSDLIVDYVGIAKILCWGLKTWKKCVFVDPNSLVLENCDELFKYEELSTVPSKKFDSSFFVFRPNSKTFDALLELAEIQNNNPGKEDILELYFKNCLGQERKQLSRVYNVEIGQGIDIGSLKPKLIRFNDFPWQMEWMKVNYGNQDFTKTWHQIYAEDVLPKISGQKRPAIKKLLQESITLHHLPPTNGPRKPLEDDIPDEFADAIAVIGMSCRFPGANNADEFWNVLAESKDPIREYPLERPNAIAASDLDFFKAGFLKCAIDEFDAKFFGISPREAPFVDPQQRLLLEVTWEGLENAGINPHALKESDTGVFMGIWQQDYDHFLPDSGLSANDFHHRYLGNAFSATASRISFHLGLNGPSLALESGCSSSMGALHLSCESLRRGETSLCISSGVNLVLMVLNPLSGDDRETVLLAKDNHCKTFDESADGFVRAEGCGALVLKRYADAKRDGDNVLAIIRGSALNNDGAGTSFGTPHAKAQERVIREAIANANIRPADVSYVEAHGTGTVVGDPTEMYAIGKVYSEDRTEPLLVSSVKTNIGHAEAAAGIAGVIKVILCLNHQEIPAHLHLKNLNPRINLDEIPAKIPTVHTVWNPSSGKRIAGVSSFSMSGTNCHMILQEAPKREEFDPKYMAGYPQLVTFSAKSEEALDALKDKYIEFIGNNPNIPLAELALSTSFGRANLSHRIAVVAKDLAQVASKLGKRAYSAGKIPPQKNKIGFLFTGQGSQYLEMGKNLYETFPAVKVAFDICDALFQQYLGVSLPDVVWNDKKLLEKTIYCQPAIFCMQYVLLQLWKHFGIQADYVLGHSVGEFAAAVCAEVLSLQDAMKLVVERSRLVHLLPTGSMMAVKESYDKVSGLIQKFQKLEKNNYVDIAAINSTEEVVVSGQESVLQNFAEYCLKSEVKSQMIPASHAFHSREMDAVLPEFGKVAETVTCNPPSIVYVSGTLARVLEVVDFGPEYWKRHLRDTVRFSEAIKTVWAECKVLIEVGAQPILLGLSYANVNEPSFGSFCPSLRRSEEDWFTVFTTLSKLYVAGVDIDWKNWFGNRQRKVILPTYPFQRQKFWWENEDGAMTLVPRILHPLLGRQMSAPLSDSIFYQTIRVKELPWLEDHKVAERVILPAAGYLECIMAAGREVLQSGSVLVPITVENLAVEAALELEKPGSIQTVVSPLTVQDGVQYQVAIHRQLISDQTDRWKRHATGVFSPSTKLPTSEVVNLEELKAQLTQKDSVEKAYATIAEMGIQFGPKFQSISKAWNGPSEVLTEIILPADFDKYICHPIILDAMIQTFAFRFALQATSESKDLQLPINIKKFIWLSHEPTQLIYAHTRWDQGEGDVSLYSETGQRLAIMEGLELLKTSVDSFIRSLNYDTSLPDFLQETWRPTIGVTSNRVNLAEIIQPTLESDNVAEVMKDVEKFESFEWNGYESVNEMFLYFLMRSLQESGFPWVVGQKLEVSQWSSLLPSTMQTEKIVLGYFEIFNTHGYMKFDYDSQSGIPLKPLATVDECDRTIRDLGESVTRYCKSDEIILEFANRFGRNATGVIQGKVNALTVLFPEDKNEAGASKLYSDSRWYQLNTKMAVALFADAVAPFMGRGKGKLRILEVGAGTGASSVPLMDKLKEMGVSYHYTFTDISPMFLAEARKKLSQDISFELLNIEEDPLTQGFAPEQYDIIVGLQVLHATADLVQSLANLRKLLKTDGAFVILEQMATIKFLSLSFGHLDGWWRFTDFRKLSPIVDAETWERCFHEAGYDRVFAVEMYRKTNGAILARAKSDVEIIRAPEVQNKIWIVVMEDTLLCEAIVQKLYAANRRVVKVRLDFTGTAKASGNPDDVVLNAPEASEFVPFFESFLGEPVENVLYFWTKPDDPQKKIYEVQEQLITGLLHLCQAFFNLALKLKPKPKLFMISRGINYIGDTVSGNPNAATGVGLLKSFANENPDFLIMSLDTDQNETNPENEINEVYAHLWTKEREQYVALREGKKYVQRLISMEKRSGLLNLPNSDRFKVINPASGAFSDLEVGPYTKMDVGKDQIEVAIRATALNFRDLFMVLKPEGFELPKDHPVEIGLDISGVVTAIGEEVTNLKVGDEVFGFTTSGGFCSHCVISHKVVMAKPPNMTFEGASTIPCAFLTAYYSLIDVAKITKEDRVLIHVASGGVGLAAIQVVQHIGSEIYATAGSKRKRAYLRSLGITKIYNSRNTDFGAGIKRDSNGAGVTVVLNSLTGPNFKETTLDVCCQGARFVEIAKLNIWKPEEVTVLRPDVEYTVVELAEKLGHNPGDTSEIFKRIENHFEAGVYYGLPHTTFPLDLLREAFYHFQEAKHIGKIVVKMPVVQMSPQGRLSLKHQLFNPQCTYLITGGLGGLGMEVTKWMTRSGAKNIVLAGRSPPKPRVQELIDSLNNSGSRIIIVQSNVGDYDQCVALMETINRSGLPPLRGIIHAAGVIADAIVPNQNWERFDTVLRPKVYGGWYLHCLTLHMPLEFFVMFSSGASIIGVMGQSNHSAANRFLDSLTYYRLSMGLKAITINWGAWSDVGAAAHIKLGQEGAVGMKSFTPARGIAYLEKILREGPSQAVVLEIVDWNIVKQFVTGLGNYLSEMRSDKSAVDNFSEEYAKMIEEIKAAPPEERQERIQNFLESILKQTLRMPETERIDPDQNFSELGVDSLMAMEMRNRLQGILGDKTLTVSALQENRTLRSLSTHMANLMNSDADSSQPVSELVKLDVVLPVDIQAAEVGPAKPSEFKELLLTGATGHLGAHFIPYLLKNYSHLRITCLVRAKTDEEAKERLMSNLKRYEMTELAGIENIVAIAGDLSKDRLGIEAEAYFNLCEKIDAIVHCAIRANHMEGYADSGVNSMRHQNVFSLVNVLRFAGTRKTKHILHASSLVAVTKADENGILSEEFPAVDDLGDERTCRSGYVLSKFVGEKLIYEAMQRGIPATVIRYTMIYGDSKTGNMPPGYNHAWNVLVSCIRVRKFPSFDQNGVPVMPADTAAEISLGLFLKDSSELGMYNLTCGSTISEQDVIEVFGKFGVDDCEWIPFTEWRNQVFEEMEQNALGPLAFLYGDEGSSPRYLTYHPLAESVKELEITKLSPKLRRNLPDVDKMIQPAKVVAEHHLDFYYKNLRRDERKEK